MTAAGSRGGYSGDMVRGGIPGLAALLIAALLAAAEPQGSSVATLISLVRQAMARKDSDSKLARDIHKIRLGQSLDDRVIEELESEGAGPKSVAELLALRDVSAGLPAPAALPDIAAPPLPLRPEQEQVVRDAAANAFSYSSSLPDFICTEVIHRFEDPGGSGKWRPKDILEAKLTYFEHREAYQLVSVNGQPARRGADFQSLGGAFSEGEFGSALLMLFSPKSKAEYRWDHWTRLRQHVAHVFSFRIKAENSQWHLEYHLRNPRYASRSAETNPGEHGFVYIDRDTGQVLRINRMADLPADFPVRSAHTLLDYDFTAVAGRQFLLPLHAEVRMDTDYVLTRNQLDFTGYRKFSGETSITFDEDK